MGNWKFIVGFDLPQQSVLWWKSRDQSLISKSYSADLCRQAD